MNDGAGLHLRTKGNSKKWVFRYVRDGKPVEIGCGGADRVSLKTARKLREKYLDALATGLDPRSEKAQDGGKPQDLRRGRRAPDRGAEKELAHRRQRRPNEFARPMDQEPRQRLPRIANRSISDIEVDDIKPIVKPVWDKGCGTSARRLLNRIEMVFSYAKAHGWRKADNPATWDLFEHILQAQGPSGPKDHHPALDWRDPPPSCPA